MAASYQHPHDLGADEARRRLLEKAAEHGVEVTFDAGSDEAGEVRAEVQVGWLADKLGGPAYVERKVDEYLDPATSLASLQARVPS